MQSRLSGGLRACIQLRASTSFVPRRSVTSSKDVELTSIRYKIKRGEYAALSNDHLSFFEKVLNKNQIITDVEECDSYNVDWIKMVKGSSRLVLKPKTTEEVSTILKYCNEQKLAVCPQSGNTGLVGGSVPVFDEIVLSMALMNKIIDIDELAGVMVCEAGCVLEALDNQLSKVGLMMPLDLGAKGSCLIGGNVSTNAGGLRLLRYGNLHGSILGLEAVKANGEVVDCLNTLKKDNTGYHLKHLFIGSEGTLGVVTKVAIQCPPLPKATNVAFLGMDNFESVLKTYKLAKSELSEILSSCELIDRPAMDAATKNLGLQNPLPKDGKGYEFYVLIETSGSQMSHDEEKVNAFVEKALTDGIIKDGTLSSDPSKIKNFWNIRERLAEAHMHDGFMFKYDFSLPLPHFYDIVGALQEHLRGCNITRISGFGHLGDGNIHIQVTTKEYDEKVARKLEPFVFDWVSKLRGSVSAEHGIGFKKTKYLRYSKDQSAIKLMHEMKRMMDPNGILNPYKVLYPIES